MNDEVRRSTPRELAARGSRLADLSIGELIAYRDHFVKLGGYPTLVADIDCEIEDRAEKWRER